jgi:hypothetical protein
MIDSNTGWIKIHRKMLDWEWYDNPNMVRLFIHLLLKANYKDKRWHGIIIKRGSLITSSVQLAEETGLTRQKVRTALGKLIKTQEINQQTTNKYTLITICNYKDYQQLDLDNPLVANHQITINQPSNNHQITTTKEDINIRDINIEERKKERIRKEKLKQKESPKPRSSTALSSNVKFDLCVVKSIFEFWKTMLKHPKAKLDEKRKRLIRNRLQEGYTVEQLQAAITGCSQSPFHMGQNEHHTRFDDLSLILRDAHHVEQFLDNSFGSSQTSDSTRLRSSQAHAAWELVLSHISRNGCREELLAASETKLAIQAMGGLNRIGMANVQFEIPKLKNEFIEVYNKIINNQGVI